MKSPKLRSPWTTLLPALAATLLFTGCCCLKSKRTTRTCLSKKGCPPQKALPRCASAATARAEPLATVLAGAPGRLLKIISVRSRLRRGGGACTRKGCAKGTCCNRCGASFALTTAQKPHPGTPHTVTLRNTAGARHPHPKLACSGDESRICCPYATGQDVVVTGRFVQVGRSIYGPYYALLDPRICRP